MASVSGFLITLAAIATVTPIVLVVGYIAWLGAPAISLEFLTAIPRDGMRAGGIWPASQMPEWLQWVGKFLPLTYGVDGIRALMARGESLVDVGRVSQVTIQNLKFTL